MKKKSTNHTGLNGSKKLEQSVFVLYDVESNKIRKKIFTACEDYGLKSIQFSVFYGYLSVNKYQELFQRLKQTAGKEANNIILLPICQADFKKILCNGKNLSMYQTRFIEFL